MTTARGLIHALVGTAAGYRLWAWPFKKPKMLAVQDLLPSVRPLRVLDVGCGPGTNAPLFRGAEYVGVDVIPAYVRSAARRYPGMTFLQGDARRLDLGPRRFDVAVLNSLLHHLDDLEAEELLRAVTRHLGPTGVLIVQEPLIPGPRELVPRLLMRLDRGTHFRDLDDWRCLFGQAALRVERERAYAIRALGLTGWHMVSFLLRPTKISKVVSQ